MHKKQEKRTKFLNIYLDIFYSVEFQPRPILGAIKDTDIGNKITNDRELMMKAVQTDGLLLEYYTGKFHYNNVGVLDDDLVLRAAKSNGMSLAFLIKDDDSECKISKEIVRQAIEEDGYIASLDPIWYSLSDKEKVLAASNGRLLDGDEDDRCIPSEVLEAGMIDCPYNFSQLFDLKNKEIIEYVIKSYGPSLDEIDEYSFSGTLSTEVLKEGFSQYPEALPSIFWNLKKNMDERFEILKEGIKSYNDVLDEDIGQKFFTREQMTELLKYSGYFIYDCIEPTREMALEAVTNCGEVLGAIPNFANDKEIVLAAVQQDAYSILYASENLIHDRYFILECVKITGKVLDYIDTDFDDDYEIILEAAKNFGDIIGITDQELRREKEIVIAALSNNGMSLGYLDEDLQNDKSIVMTAVSNNGLALEYASDRLQNDKEVVLTAISNMPIAFRHASEELRSDKEVILHVVSLDYHALESATEKAKNDRDIIMECVKISGLCLLNASNDLKKDREIVLQAVTQNGLALKFANVFDEEIARIALQNNSTVFKKLPPHLQRVRKIAKLAKDESEMYWEAWIDYWGKRSEVFDVPIPKRKRSQENDGIISDDEENDEKEYFERERKKLKDE